MPLQPSKIVNKAVPEYEPSKPMESKENRARAVQKIDVFNSTVKEENEDSGGGFVLVYSHSYVTWLEREIFQKSIKIKYYDFQLGFETILVVLRCHNIYYTELYHTDEMYLNLFINVLFISMHGGISILGVGSG